MHGITSATEKTWFIIHNNDGIVAHGCIEVGQNANTPESNTLESFATEEAYLARCEELGIDLDL